MGNTATQAQCLGKLGVQQALQRKFKADVLKYLEDENGYGRDLHLAKSKASERFTKSIMDYIRSERFLKHRSVSSTEQDIDLMRNESDMYSWLSQLVDIWVMERERKQSQEDPAYSESPFSGRSINASTPAKKRKKLSDQSNQATVGQRKQQKGPQTAQLTEVTETSATATRFSHINVHGEQTNVHSQRPRGFTVQAADEPLQDIAHRSASDAESDSSLPDLIEIATISPEKRLAEAGNTLIAPTTPPPLSNKGKAPVRDPPVPQPVQTTRSTPAGPLSAKVAKSAPQSSGAQYASRHNNDVTPSKQARVHSKPGASNYRRNIMSIERSEDDASFSANQISFASTSPSVGSRTMQQASQSTDLPTPPPTVRHPQFTDPTGICSPAAAVLVPELVPHEKPFGERVQDMLYGITEYIQICENQSNDIAHHPCSSEREKQHHNIRAAAFAHLRLDIASRVDAFIKRENGGLQIDPITDYCMHYL